MRVAHTVAVIGGGLAGLTAASLLASRGVAVSVFEANAKAGGCCATTTVDGYTFNDGAVYLALPGLLDALFAALDLDRAILLPLRRIPKAQKTSLPDGSTVVFDDGIRVDRGNSDDAARTAEELNAFLRKWEPVLRLFADDLLLRPFSPAHFLHKGWHLLPRLRGTAAAQLRASFSSEAVRAALAGALLFNGAPAQKLPAVSLLAVAAMFRDGFFLPEGGMGAIPAALADSARSRGAAIHLESPVRRIVLDRGRAAGIELMDGSVFSAHTVVSTVSALHTFGSLLPADAVPRRMGRKLRRAPLSHTALILQLGLARPIEGDCFSHYTLPWLADQPRLFAPCTGLPVWPLYTVPTAAMPELASAGGGIIEMYPPIDQTLAPDAWTDERKQAVADRAVARLREMHPMDVRVQRILSPREFQDQLHLYHGALYGLSPAAGPAALFDHRTPIPGLYQAGQTTWPGFGVAGAALSGMLSAQALLDDAGV